MLPCLAPLILYVRCAANVPRSWSRQERLGAPRSVQQCPGTPRSALELSGIPGSAQERSGASSSTQQCPTAPKRARERPREPRIAQERQGAPRSVREPQECPGTSKLRGAPRCAQERPGTPRSVQESRTKSRTNFPPRENEKSFQESLERLFGPLIGSCVGAYYVAKINVFGISSGRSENFVCNFVWGFKKFRLTFRRGVRQISSGAF